MPLPLHHDSSAVHRNYTMQGFRDAKIQLQKRLFMPIMFPWSDRLVLATQESLRPVRELPLPSG